jgi:transposase
MAKKLARGRFHLVRQVPEGATHIEVEAAELSLMLEGLDLSHAKKRMRWRPDVAKNNSQEQSLIVRA